MAPLSEKEYQLLTRSGGINDPEETKPPGLCNRDKKEQDVGNKAVEACVSQVR